MLRKMKSVQEIMVKDGTYANVSHFSTTDMFAIPDYGSGATEHWGIITYRESRLLYTPGVSSQGNKVSSASIIAHECAHLVI